MLCQEFNAIGKEGSAVDMQGVKNKLNLLILQWKSSIKMFIFYVLKRGYLKFSQENYLTKHF